MSEIAQTHVPVDSPEGEERIHRIGWRLASSSTIMFFLGFVFSYFYLRSLNNADLWRPKGTDPPQAYGAIIVAAFVLSALVFSYAARAPRGRGSWIAASGVALVLALVGCVAQGFEYAHIEFGPQSGGYASVFVCWTALYAVVVLLFLYRLETAFAEGLRNRASATTFRPIGLVAASDYWALLAGIGVLAWVILYLV
jgi:heme/copper-type cytochrome/quinol oxidase subunit 3